MCILSQAPAYILAVMLFLFPFKQAEANLGQERASKLRGRESASSLSVPGALGGSALPRLAQKFGVMCRDPRSSWDPKGSPQWGLIPPGRSGFLSELQSFENGRLRGGQHGLGEPVIWLLLPQVRGSSC